MCNEEYNVGVRIVNIGDGTNAGVEGTIYLVGNGKVYVQYDNGNQGASDNPKKYYKIISSCNKTTQMNSIINFAKNLVLSADEKLLRKYGLKDDCGNYSSEAREVVLQKLFADNEAYLITIATQKAAEDKENK